VNDYRSSLFETLFEEIPAALAVLRGPEFIFEAANEDYFNLIGRNDILGKTLLEALPELADQPFPAILRDVMQTGKTFQAREIEAWLLLEGKLQQRFVDVTYRRISPVSGGATGIFVFAIDVSEKVRARTEVQLERMKLESIFLNSPAPLAITRGAEFVFENANRSYIDLFQNRDLLGKTLLEALPELIDQKFPALFEKVFRTGEEYREKEAVAFLRRSASSPLERRYFDQSYTRITDSAGAPYGVLIQAVDVTERVDTVQSLRRSERESRQMADAMPQVVWTAGPDGHLDYTNERWFQYSGSRDPAQWLNFVHPSDVDQVVEQWTKSVTTGDIYENEFRLRRIDGTYRWFLVRAQASKAADGTIERWFGTCTDIEEQKAAVAARNEFMSIASHELKTPLTSLKLQTQSMRRNFERGRADAYSTEKVGQMVASNEKQVGRLIRLVDDMLDFSKIEAGKLSMNSEPADLAELVREVYDRLAEQLTAAGCFTSLELSRGVMVNVDHFRIEQVITNLLTNAARYGQGTPVFVKVYSEGGKALISVADQGIGISEEFRERIFNRFERGVSASQVSGLGLGLFISREIVHAHGGRIWAEGGQTSGSVFYVELPST
jgi:PAS domain S-box-containing protein